MDYREGKEIERLLYKIEDITQNQNLNEENDMVILLKEIESFYKSLVRPDRYY